MSLPASPLAAPGNAPIYRKLAGRLHAEIAAGNWQSGDALPSERDLCTIMGASRVTVRKAIDLLAVHGIVSRRHGSGTYVNERIQAPGSFLSSFSEDASARGDTDATIWIAKTIGTATPDDAAALDLAAGAAIARLTRVRMARGAPLAIENAAVPMAMLADLGAVGASLYRALSAAGNAPVSGVQRVRADRATAAEAARLDIAEGSPVLRIERLTRRSDGAPVELTKSVYRGDRYEFVSDLSPLPLPARGR